MIPTGAKFWFAVTSAAVLASAIYGLASDWEKLGTFVLGFLAVAAFLLGLASVLWRDGDDPWVAAGEDEAPAAPEAAPAGPPPASPWPAVAAFGLAVTIVGLAAGGALIWVGLGVFLVVLVEWMVQAWSERATADPAYNRSLRDHVLYPFEIPLAGAVVIAVIVLAFSRVLLALPATGSTVVAISVATVVLTVGAVLAARPRISSQLAAAALVVGSVAVIAGGIAAALVGERDFEHHEAEEHGEEGGEADEAESEEADSEEEGGGVDDTDDEGGAG